MFTKAHQHHVHKLFHLKEKLGRLYLHLIIQALAISMISVFVPIHLLKLGISLKSVFIFLFIQWAFFAFFSPVAGYLVNKIGVKEVILIRTPFLILALVLLNFVEKNIFIRENYFIIAVFLGVSSCLYTISITSLFSEFMHKNKKSLETSKFMSFPQLGTMIGPFLGSFVAMKFGFSYLFLAVSIILLISLIPISFIKHKVDHPRYEYKKFISFFKKYKKLFFFMNIYGIKGFVYFILLPIAIYLSAKEIVSLGFVLSFISLINMYFTIQLGKYLDKHSRKLVIIAGAIFTAIAFIIFSHFLSSPYLIYVSIIYGFVGLLLDLPMESEIYNHAKIEKSHVSFLVFKESSFLFGRSLLFLFLIFLLENLNFTFYLGAAASLIMGFL